MAALLRPPCTAWMSSSANTLFGGDVLCSSPLRSSSLLLLSVSLAIYDVVLRLGTSVASALLHVLSTSSSYEQIEPKNMLDVPLAIGARQEACRRRCQAAQHALWALLPAPDHTDRLTVNPSLH